MAAVAVAGVGCKSTKPADGPAIPDSPVSEKSSPPPKSTTTSSWKEAGSAPIDPAPVSTTSYASSSGAGASGRSYVVKKGDTLYSIARLYYKGDNHKWRAIYEANRDRIPDQNHLTVGQTLSIPD